MTLSNRWPYWFSISWAVLTISWKSSSCSAHKNRRQKWNWQKAKLNAQTESQAVNFRLLICYTVNKKGDKYCEQKLHRLEQANKYTVAWMKPVITSHIHQPGHQLHTKTSSCNSLTSKNFTHFLHQLHMVIQFTKENKKHTLKIRTAWNTSSNSTMSTCRTSITRRSGFMSEMGMWQIVAAQFHTETAEYLYRSWWRK